MLYCCWSLDHVCGKEEMAAGPLVLHGDLDDDDDTTYLACDGRHSLS